MHIYIYIYVYIYISICGIVQGMFFQPCSSTGPVLHFLFGGSLGSPLSGQCSAGWLCFHRFGQRMLFRSDSGVCSAGSRDAPEFQPSAAWVGVLAFDSGEFDFGFIASSQPRKVGASQLPKLDWKLFRQTLSLWLNGNPIFGP